MGTLVSDTPDTTFFISYTGAPRTGQGSSDHLDLHHRIQYIGARGRIGILSESYSYATFEDPV